MSIVVVLGLVALAVLVIVRQILPRRLSWRMLAVMPVVFAYLAFRQWPAGPLGAREGLELAAELVIGGACGIWQAKVTRVFDRHGQWYLRGGWLYLAGWVVFLATRIGLDLVLLGPSAFSSGGAQPADGILILGAAMVWAVRAAALYLLHPELAHRPPTAEPELGA